MRSGQGKGEHRTVHATVEGQQLSGANAGGGPKGLQREGTPFYGLFFLEPRGLLLPLLPLSPCLLPLWWGSQDPTLPHGWVE